MNGYKEIQMAMRDPDCCGTIGYHTLAKGEGDRTRIDVKTWPGRRRRIRGARAQFLSAAFVAFTKSGYAAASMLEIATRARVSKRELYALVGNKQKMLITCIRERAKRLEVPAHLPVAHDRETLA